MLRIEKILNIISGFSQVLPTTAFVSLIWVRDQIHFVRVLESRNLFSYDFIYALLHYLNELNVVKTMSFSYVLIQHLKFPDLNSCEEVNNMMQKKSDQHQLQNLSTSNFILELVSNTKTRRIWLYILWTRMRCYLPLLCGTYSFINMFQISSKIIYEN